MNGEDMNITTQAKFLLHVQKYGLQYAVAYLVVDQLGLITELTGYLGGMC